MGHGTVTARLEVVRKGGVWQQSCQWTFDSVTLIGEGGVINLPKYG